MAGITFDHMHIRSPDVEATAAWFERVLGAEVIRSTQQGKPRVDLKLGGANIFIAPGGKGTGTNPNPSNPYLGLDHFGLRVTDIDEVVAQIKAKGVSLVVEPHNVRPDLRIAFLKSPEGVMIELLQRS
jgi:lactoylglutathione lyase